MLSCDCLLSTWMFSCNQASQDYWFSAQMKINGSQATEQNRKTANIAWLLHGLLIPRAQPRKFKGSAIQSLATCETMLRILVPCCQLTDLDRLCKRPSPSRTRRSGRTPRAFWLSWIDFHGIDSTIMFFHIWSLYELTLFSMMQEWLWRLTCFFILLCWMTLGTN